MHHRAWVQHARILSGTGFIGLLFHSLHHILVLYIHDRLCIVCVPFIFREKVSAQYMYKYTMDSFTELRKQVYNHKDASPSPIVCE